MILFDLSQIVIASATNKDGYNSANSDKDNKLLIKHMFFNSVKSHIKNNKRKYGNTIVFAADSRKYWRKQIFPYYKYSRKKNRDNSYINWELIFEIIKELKEEIVEYFPYYLLEVEGAEADDIIFTLCKYTKEYTLIIGSDHDYHQVHSELVQQYCPKTKKMLVIDDKYTLFKHIIGGDKGDGIPNIKSPIDAFYTGTRQAPITQKFIDECIKDGGVPEQYGQRYKENAKLIMAGFIPVELSKTILYRYENYDKLAPRSKIYDYLLKNSMKVLLSSIQDF